MPIFEYRCSDCETKFEKLVRRAEDAVECPKCGPEPAGVSKRRLEIQHSTFAAHANGAPRAAGRELPPCASGVCPTPGMCGRN